MTRRTDIRRDSRPTGPALFADDDEKARLEARNGLLQVDEIKKLAVASFGAGSRFALRTSTLLRLHRIAIHEIYTCAGRLRDGHVEIHGTTHAPPPYEEVPELVEGMCEYVDANWDERSPLHLSAYLMWRVNWIHPFFGGNGRVSRATSYLVLLAKLGYQLPGVLTIPEQIVDHRQPYYEALDAADSAWEDGRVDVTAMEALLEKMLAQQLLEVVNAARGEG